MDLAVGDVVNKFKGKSVLYYIYIYVVIPAADQKVAALFNQHADLFLRSLLEIC